MGNDMTLIVAYARVSTDSQGDDGAGMQAQVNAIETAASARGWTITTLHRDVASGGSMKRTGLQAALAELRAPNGPRVLCVAKLDRLSRSLLDFARLMEQAKREGWAIVALDLGLDMTTPAGALVANVMAAVAAWERATISDRTKAAMRVKIEAGVHCGRPRSIPVYVREWVVKARSEGMTYSTIGNALESAGIAPSRGGKRWHSSTLRRIA